MSKQVSRTFYKRSRKINRHHILARSRRGTKTARNLIRLDINRHAAFHLLFGTRTFKEAAQVLIRASEMKEKEVIDHES